MISKNPATPLTTIMNMIKSAAICILVNFLKFMSYSPFKLFITSLATSIVVALPPKSPVKVLASFNNFNIASSNLSAASFSPRYLSIIIADSIMAIGFALFWPAMSGAEPCTGSNNAASKPMFADGISPSPPTRPAPSSESMSPKRLVVTIILFQTVVLKMIIRVGEFSLVDAPKIHI